MDTIDITTILNRNKIEDSIKSFFINFEKEKNDMGVKRGIYIYGNPGTGKSMFIEKILKELNYDIVKYDAGDIRNKSIIDTITKHNMSDRNVLSMLRQNVKKIAIIMDEIDGMNNGDKGGINQLIKLIRPKKTKKQKLEETTLNPIICIGNYHIDKKIKELMKVCHSYEIKNPTTKEIESLLMTLMPSIDNILKKNLINYIQGDLRKFDSIFNIYNKQHILLKNEIIQNVFQPKTYNEDSKKITQRLINTNFELNEHNIIMNETDRTIVGLLWHENIVDVLAKQPHDISFPFYNQILDNMCFADYIDRITFQNQIWQLNEMSSLMKTFHNNKIYHDNFPENKGKFQPSEVRFTKVLTKYSTEYNNMVFIYNLCQELDLDKYDLISMFQEIRLLQNTNKLTYVEFINEIEKIFENYNINKLDIQRIYRYIDKSVKKDQVSNDIEDTD